MCYSDKQHGDNDRRRAKKGRPSGVSFPDNDDTGQTDATTTTSRPAAERDGKPSLMSFPSLEHLDHLSDGSPWRSTTRRRRKFRGGIGGLHRRPGEAADPVDDDDAELDRVEPVPDTSHQRPVRTSTGVGRSASAAARQRERSNRAGQRPSQPDNRIYRPVTRPQPLPPPPLAPRAPAPVVSDELRVTTEDQSSSIEVDVTESRPRRQRRRRPRGEAEAEVIQSFSHSFIFV